MKAMGWCGLLAALVVGSALAEDVESKKKLLLELERASQRGRLETLKLDTVNTGVAPQIRMQMRPDGSMNGVDRFQTQYKFKRNGEFLMQSGSGRYCVVENGNSVCR